MPNKCTKCGKLHADDAPYLLTTGCDGCGGRFFFFVREDALSEVDKELSQISTREINEIERDIRDILPAHTKTKLKKSETIVMDIEAIRVIKPGKYMINVKNLLNQKPVVIRVGTGRYEIDLSTIAKPR